MITPRRQHLQKFDQRRALASAPDALPVEWTLNRQVLQRNDPQRTGLQFQGDNQARHDGQPMPEATAFLMASGLASDRSGLILTRPAQRTFHHSPRTRTFLA